MAIVSILRSPLPQGGAIQTLYTVSKSWEIANSISLCNTYGMDVSVYLAIVPASGWAPTGALVYGQIIGPNEMMTFDQRYMRINDRIQGYANVGNAVQLVANILTP